MEPRRQWIEMHPIAGTAIHYLRQGRPRHAFLAVIFNAACAGMLAFLYARSRDSGLVASRLGTAATLSAPRRTAVRREGDGLFISR